jgi:hypothetical protein
MQRRVLLVLAVVLAITAIAGAYHLGTRTRPTTTAVASPARSKPTPRSLLPRCRLQVTPCSGPSRAWAKQTYQPSSPRPLHYDV